MNQPESSKRTEIGLDFLVERDGLSLSVTYLSNLVLKGSDDDFIEYEEALFKEIRAKMTLDEAKDDFLFRSFRDLYWTFGMDPTKDRVSSEAVLRRILKGLNLWRISNLVDVVNLASAFHKLPISLIDESKRVGNLSVRSARNGEVFTRIGGDTITCRGREIVLADQEKIVCYGYATHDSEITKVSKITNDVLLVHYGTSAVSKSILNQAIDTTLNMVQKWVDCDILWTHVYSTDS